MKIELDPFTKKRVLDTMTKSTDPKDLAIELATEFGRRWGEAVAQGIPHAVAFEACKDNFVRTGECMVAIGKTITLEMMDKVENDSV